MKNQNRPYIICHILSSINGKISGSYFRRPETRFAAKLYQALHQTLEADAVAYGRTTVSEVFTKGKEAELDRFQGVKETREDYVAVTDSPYYLVSVDPDGGLGWEGATVQGRREGYDGAHIIEVLTEKVPDAYLACLREKKISYLFAGKERLAPETAAEKLYRLFGIRRMLLQGGGITNGTFADVIDELSLVVAPVTECGSWNPTVFEQIQGKAAGSMSQGWELVETRAMEDSVLWMRYRKKGEPAS